MCSSVLELIPTEGKWKYLPPMKFLWGQVAAVTLGTEIFAIGQRNRDGAEICRVEIFNGKEWRTGPSLPFYCWETYTVIIPQHLADHLCSYQNNAW